MKDVIGGYQLVSKIGAGARSIVYRARHVRSGRTVAIKCVEKVDEDSLKPLRHMANEYRNWKALAKAADREGQPLPNLVKFHALLNERSLFRLQARYLVMDYIRGRTLDDYADYTMHRLIHLFTQVCHVLHFMHTYGFVHADLKPNNIIVDGRGEATVIDLGFSCPVGAKCSSIKGTLDYIAPEQTNGGVLTAATDVYNLGAAMYRVFTGRPIKNLTIDSGMAAFSAGHVIKATPAHQLNPYVPRDLSALIDDCIQRRPSKRPSSALDVALRLKELALVMAHREGPLAKAV